MVSHVHETLRRLFYEKGGIDPDQVEIAFAMPVRRFYETLTCPALLFSLLEMRENVQRRTNEVSETRVGGNRAVRRLAPRRLDLSYIVTASATVPDDEYTLLTRAATVLMRYEEVPDDVLHPDVRQLNVPVRGRVAAPGDEQGARPLELWGTLGGIEPRAALLYTLTIPLDLDVELEAPLVLTRQVQAFPGLALPPRPERGAAEKGSQSEVGRTGTLPRFAVGGRLTDESGNALSGAVVRVASRALPDVTADADGRWVLPGLHAGRHELIVASPQGAGLAPRRVEIVVPSDNYDFSLSAR